MKYNKVLESYIHIHTSIDNHTHANVCDSHTCKYMNFIWCTQWFESLGMKEFKVEFSSTCKTILELKDVICLRVKTDQPEVWFISFSVFSVWYMTTSSQMVHPGSQHPRLCLIIYALGNHFYPNNDYWENITVIYTCYTWIN